MHQPLAIHAPRLKSAGAQLDANAIGGLAARTPFSCSRSTTASSFSARGVHSMRQFTRGAAAASLRRARWLRRAAVRPALRQQRHAPPPSPVRRLLRHVPEDREVRRRRGALRELAPRWGRHSRQENRPISSRCARSDGLFIEFLPSIRCGLLHFGRPSWNSLNVNLVEAASTEFSE
jgi:hypothetical protein